MSISSSEIIALHGKATDAEHHFNNLQMEYRKLASVWLIAVFSGSGFLIAKDYGEKVYIELLIGGIGFAGAIGICLLWYLDLIVYQNLLRGHFLAALRLEKKYKFLPKTRSIMLELDSGKGAAAQVITFYIASTLVCFVVSATGLVVGVVGECAQLERTLSIILGIVEILFLLVIVLWLLTNTKRLPRLRKVMAKKFKLSETQILN